MFSLFKSQANKKLLDGIKHGDLKQIEEAIKKKADLNAENGAALKTALIKFDYNILKLLLTANITFPAGNTLIEVLFKTLITYIELSAQTSAYTTKTKSLIEQLNPIIDLLLCHGAVGAHFQWSNDFVNSCAILKTTHEQLQKELTCRSANDKKFESKITSHLYFKSFFSTVDKAPHLIASVTAEIKKDKIKLCATLHCQILSKILPTDLAMLALEYHYEASKDIEALTVEKRAKENRIISLWQQEPLTPR